jgi:hypothetical protein
MLYYKTLEHLLAPEPSVKKADVRSALFVVGGLLSVGRDAIGDDIQISLPPRDVIGLEQRDSAETVGNKDERRGSLC